MARIGHADRLSSGLPSGALRYFDDDVAAIQAQFCPQRFLQKRATAVFTISIQDSEN